MCSTFVQIILHTLKTESLHLLCGSCNEDQSEQDLLTALRAGQTQNEACSAKTCLLGLSA